MLVVSACRWCVVHGGRSGDGQKIKGPYSGLHFPNQFFNPYLPTEHRGTIGTFERIPEYIIADFPMVAKLSPRTIGRSPRVDSPL